MTLSDKAILFDWAYTLVDLGEEDDRAPFCNMLSLLKKRAIFNGNFETIYQDYKKIFHGMIEVSRSGHREANFELVLKYLFLKYKINLEDKITLKKVLDNGN